MKTAGSPIRFALTFICPLIVLVISCAKSLPPPGGPQDKTPPEFIASVPASAATGIPLDSGVEIYFSEALDLQTVPKAIFITPQIDPAPEIRVKGNQISIEFPDGLKPERTYVLTVGTDLKDAHRVSLAQSLTIAFSTGDFIDSGSISGTIYIGSQGVSNISLALFEDLPEAESLSADSLIPLYLTQSGKDGYYKFDYLPAGNYYLIAFDDKNKNRRINLQSELIGIPYRDLVLSEGNSTLSDIDIRLHKFESTLLEFKTVSFNSSQLLKIRFNRVLEDDDARKILSQAQITNSDDSVKVANIIDFISINPYPSADFLMAPTSLPPQEYKLRLDRRLLSKNLPDSLSWLTYTFNVTETDDELPPELLDSDPSHNDDNIPIDKEFGLLFSEPLDTFSLTTATTLVGCHNDTGSLQFKSINLFQYSAKQSYDLNHGCDYLLIIKEAMVKDLKGNQMGDSTRVIAFTTVGKDTLGSLSGTIFYSNPDDSLVPVVVEFLPAADEGSAKKLYLEAGKKQFNSQFYPGYYSISGFLDKNANGKYDYGLILPYTLAEPFTNVTDTFRVRTRFETTGIEIEF